MIHKVTEMVRVMKLKLRKKKNGFWEIKTNSWLIHANIIKQNRDRSHKKKALYKWTVRKTSYLCIVSPIKIKIKEYDRK